MTAIETKDHPAVLQARCTADTARAALRAHLGEIERLKGLTADYEDACRQANDALVVAERRARYEAVAV